MIGSNVYDWDLGIIGDDGDFLSYYAGTPAGALGTGVSVGNSDTDHDNMANWLKHMSIWLTNFKENQYSAMSRDPLIPDADYSPTSKVLIDKFSLKDFNYYHSNASTSMGDYPRGRLEISTGSTFKSLEASTDLSSSFANNISSVKTSSPSILCFGFRPTDDSDQPLGKGNVSGSSKNFTDFEWPVAFYLNDFKCSNLNNVGPIADKGIRGAVSSMMHDNSDSNNSFIALGDNFGDYNLDDSSVNPSHTLPNRQNNPRISCSLSTMKTTLSVSSVNTGAKTITYASASGWVATSDPNPIKVGQTIRHVHGADLDGSSLTVEALSGNANTGLTITTSETPSGDINTDSDAMVLEQGMCGNFSRKGGFITFLNTEDGGNPIKKEQIACSARVLGIVEKTSDKVTLRVDTVKPLMSDKDEKYIVYLYNHHVNGSNATSSSAEADCG